MLRHLVSGSRHRLRAAGGFDLDLSYITPSLIAMGFPSSGPESLFRDSAAELARYLEGAHGGAGYLVVNLSCRSYDVGLFNGRVIDAGFDDRHSAPLELVLTLCRTIDAFLASDPDAVVAVHCLAGKGRTGLVCCAYLLWSGFFHTPAGRAAGEAAVRALHCAAGAGGEPGGAPLSPSLTQRLARAATAAMGEEEEAEMEAAVAEAEAAAASGAASMAAAASGAASMAAAASGASSVAASGAASMAVASGAASMAAADLSGALEPCAVSIGGASPLPVLAPLHWRVLGDFAACHFIHMRGEGLGIASQMRSVRYVARIVAGAVAAVAAAPGGGGLRPAPIRSTCSRACAARARRRSRPICGCRAGRWSPTRPSGS